MREGHLEVDTSHPQGTRDVFLLIGGDCMSFCSTVTNTEQLHRNNVLIIVFLRDIVWTPWGPCQRHTHRRPVHVWGRGPLLVPREPQPHGQQQQNLARRTVTGAEPCPTAQVSWNGQVIHHAKHRPVAPVSKVVTNPLQPCTPLDTPLASSAYSSL